jgi:hypothetical protein
MAMTWHGRYILDADWNPVPCEDILEWGRWMEKAERHLSHDIQEDARDGTQIRISTVFLGLDHAFGNEPAILWETMIFGGLLDGFHERYATKAEALAGHQEACRQVATTLTEKVEP